MTNTDFVACDVTESSARDMADIAVAHRQTAKAEGSKLPLKHSLRHTDRDGINKRARVLAAVNSTSIFFTRSAAEVIAIPSVRRET